MTTSNALSYWFSQTSYLGIHNSFAREEVRGGVYLYPRTELERLVQPASSIRLQYRPFFGIVEMVESDIFPLEVTMEIPKQLVDFLDRNKVHYEILHHSEAVTAQRIAQAEHIKGRHQAKVVMVKSGDQHLMIVLPADHHIDLEKIEKAIGKPVSLGRENDFKSLFPDSVVGAMPPFGNLYGLPTYVDKYLAEQDYIVFEAGTHTDAIKMSYSDYEKIVKPKVEDLAIKFQPMKGV